MRSHYMGSQYVVAQCYFLASIIIAMKNANSQFQLEINFNLQKEETAAAKKLLQVDV